MPRGKREIEVQVVVKNKDFVVLPRNEATALYRHLEHMSLPNDEYVVIKSALERLRPPEGA